MAIAVNHVERDPSITNRPTTYESLTSMHLAIVHRHSTEELPMKMLALMTTILAAACHTGPASGPTTAPSWSGAPAHTAPTALTTTELAGRRAQMIAWLHDYM